MCSVFKAKFWTEKENWKLENVFTGPGPCLDPGVVVVLPLLVVLFLLWGCLLLLALLLSWSAWVGATCFWDRGVGGWMAHYYHHWNGVKLYRQGPRLTLKKVRRGNEVPKKRDFNFDGWYIGQMSLFSPKWGIFGTAHAWIFRISWETQKKFTNIVVGAPKVSSSGLGRVLSSVFLS